MLQLSRALTGMFATLGALATSPGPEWTNDTQGENDSGFPQLEGDSRPGHKFLSFSEQGVDFLNGGSVARKLQTKSSWSIAQASTDIPGRSYHTALLVGAEILIFGGQVKGSNKYVNDLVAWNFPAKTWSIKKPSGTWPAPRAGHSAWFYSDKMLIFGGHTVDGPQNDLHAWYAWGKNHWSQLTPSGVQPWHLTGHTAVVDREMGDRMIIFGGVGGSNEGGKDSNNLYAYNVLSNSWSKLSPSGTLPAPRSQHSACLEKGKMWVFGGRTQSSRLGWVDLSDLWAYDAAANHWTAVTGSKPPGARHGHSLFSSGRNLYVYGGNVRSFHNKTSPADLWIYPLWVKGHGWNQGDISWSEISPQQTAGKTEKPSWTEGHATVPFPGGGLDRFMAFGGVQGQIYSSSWVLINRLPEKPERLYMDEAVMHWTDVPAKGLNMMFMLTGAVLVMVLLAARGRDWACVSGKRFSSEDERPPESGLEVSDLLPGDL